MWDKITDFTDRLDWSDVFFMVSGSAFGIALSVFWIGLLDDVSEWGTIITLLVMAIWTATGIITLHSALKYKDANKAGVVQK